MPTEHPNADQLLDYALLLPDSELEVRQAGAPNPAALDGPEEDWFDGPLTERELSDRIYHHLNDCVLCRIHVSRLVEAGDLEPADDSDLANLLNGSPVLDPLVQQFVTATSASTVPAAGEVWRVGEGQVHLVWIRKVVGPATLDVVPLTSDPEMADDQTLIVSADQNLLNLPLIAHVPLRTHVHLGAFVNRLQALDIADHINELVAADREGRPANLANVGLPIVNPDDQRLEYRDILRDAFSDMAPSIWTANHTPQTATPTNTDNFVGHQGPIQTSGHTPNNEAAQRPGKGPTEPDDGFSELKAELQELLDPSVRCVRCKDLSHRTPIGEFAAFAKVHYIDTSVLVVLFNDPNTMLPTAAQTVAGVDPLLAKEMDVNAVAIARHPAAQEALLLTRAAMRPALVVPVGLQSEAALTYEGLTLVDTLRKYLDGEQTKWEVLDRSEDGLPQVNVTDSARGHALDAIVEAKRKGSRSPQPQKRQTWGALTDELAETVAAFVTAVTEDDLQRAIEGLGVETE